MEVGKLKIIRCKGELQTETRTNLARSSFHVCSWSNTRNKITVNSHRIMATVIILEYVKSSSDKRLIPVMTIYETIFIP